MGLYPTGSPGRRLRGGGRGWVSTPPGAPLTEATRPRKRDSRHGGAASSTAPAPREALLYRLTPGPTLPANARGPGSNLELRQTAKFNGSSLRATPCDEPGAGTTASKGSKGTGFCCFVVHSIDKPGRNLTWTTGTDSAVRGRVPHRNGTATSCRDKKPAAWCEARLAYCSTAQVTERDAMHERCCGTCAEGRR